MKVYYDSEYTEELTQKIYEKFMEDAQDRNKVHLSDTCHCPLKCWNRLVGIKPLPPDATGVGIMMIGVVGQEIIQNVYPEDWAEWEPDKNLPEEEQVPSHIDIYVQEEDRQFPVEIKWSRKAIYRGTDIGKGWLMQTTGYMAKTMENEGKFVVFNIITGRLNGFKVLMTDAELRDRKNLIDTIKAEILKAVAEMNPMLLEPWEEECKYCPYRDTRARTKEGLGKGCPRYKGRTLTQTQVLSYISQAEG